MLQCKHKHCRKIKGYILQYNTNEDGNWCLPIKRVTDISDKTLDLLSNQP